LNESAENKAFLFVLSGIFNRERYIASAVILRLHASVVSFGAVANGKWSAIIMSFRLLE